MVDRAKEWLFIKNNYPCASENEEKFFPANIEEFCVSYCNSENEPVIHPNIFWHHVNATTFPRLKKLKIIDVIREHTNNKGKLKQVLKNNFASLVGNGLKSLQLTLKRFDLRDLENALLYPSHITRRVYQEPIDVLLKSVGDSLGKVDRSNRKNGTTRSTKLSNDIDFILKIEFMVDVNVDLRRPQLNGPGHYSTQDIQEINDLVRKNGFYSISDALLKIVSWLGIIYNSFMFAFKLKFIHVADHIDIGDVLKSATEKHRVFQNMSNCVVHNEILVEGYDNAVMLVSTFKGWNKRRNNMSSRCRNMDPKYEFECYDCCSESFTEY